MLIRTTATEKLLKLNKRLRIAQGGAGASKTYSILMILIDYAQSKKNETIDVISESFPHLEGGAIKDFKEILIAQGSWKDSLWNESKHFYTFETGTTLNFKSVDKLGKAHGPRRSVLFLNEANNISWAIAEQLILRTKNIVWIDFNPIQEFWFHTEIEGKRKDYDFIKLTFLDNEALSEGEKTELLSKKGNARFWKVYGLGELGEAEGRIYTGWQIIDEIPHEARLERYGLDFGYNPDPMALIDVYKY